MANWSTTSMTFMGTNEQLQQASDYILSNVSEPLDLKSFLNEAEFEKAINVFLVPKNPSGSDNPSLSERAEYSPMEIGGIQLSKTDDKKDLYELTIQGVGRWCGPSGFFIDTCKHAGVSGIYTDSEVGCNFFQKIEVKKNKEDDFSVNFIETDYESKESIEYYGVEHFECECAYLMQEHQPGMG